MTQALDRLAHAAYGLEVLDASEFAVVFHACAPNITQRCGVARQTQYNQLGAT